MLTKDRITAGIADQLYAHTVPRIARRLMRFCPTWLPTLRAALGPRIAVVLVLGAVLAGCASDPGAAERALVVQNWLVENSQPISITRVTGASPDPGLIERESTWLEYAAAAGLAGALAPWVGLASMGIFNVELAAFLTPIFAVGAAVYEAIEATPQETSISLDQIPDAAPLLARGLYDQRFENALIARIASTGNRDRKRRWRIVEPDLTAEPRKEQVRSGAVVTIALERFSFLQDKGEEDLAFTVRGKTYVEDAMGSRRILWHRWSYESVPHSFADWEAEEGALFDKVLMEAMDQIAREIVDSFGEVLPGKGGNE